ncbi:MULTISPECIES: MotA/TolQ/ExbB proton channel family protein [unclassified Acinetobacter]|uniref:MotA/TolQ/ExbB proton channel family protein n=1 Tax=unclassified Acinetobacter TaxID=196816 RepID=UPI0008D3A96E|nr:MULTISPECIES: MotA/TolQ/ExbB proton channel family protein [unclassified Acinetobacter]SEM33321.1 MotA/TolQ/ExbB proton channel family protein [Acinetobacter sp. DSM 11652]
MQILEVESLIYQASKLFLWPVMLLILISLIFSLVSLGSFIMECVFRTSKRYRSILMKYAEQNQFQASTDDLELWIIKRLEWLRIVSRTAPMLGLIATMIPMGPALLALSSGQAEQVGQNMVMAFSSVILSLVSASICFYILVIRRRWLLEELREYEKEFESLHQGEA